MRHMREYSFSSKTDLRRLEEECSVCVARWVGQKLSLLSNYFPRQWCLSGGGWGEEEEEDCSFFPTSHTRKRELSIYRHISLFHASCYQEHRKSPIALYIDILFTSTLLRGSSTGQGQCLYIGAILCFFVFPQFLYVEEH